VLALAVGGLAALSAALALSPLAAFAAGLMLVLVAAALARPKPEPPRKLPEPAPAPRGEALVGMPQGFGRALIEKLPTPLLVISRTGRVVYANPAAHGVLPRLEPGAHFASLIRAPAFVEVVNASLDDGGERGVRFTTHQGRERFYEARVGRLPAGASFGPEAQAIVQLEDRTEARRAEQLRSDFIANAGHELRTPLASIIGYIETLQHHAREDEEARERFLGIMAREAGRMQRLVDDLMSLSRIEMSEHVRPVEAWSLNAIAHEAATALVPIARQQGVELAIELEPAGARVLGDRDQLAQVFANLIDNAMRYSGAGSRVRVFAADPSRAHPNRHGVTVEDDGPGIAREHIHRLTERFFRVNAGHSRAKGGTGLGLAIVKHILNRHEGRLEIVSTFGAGSAFTVWVPAAEADAGVPTAPPSDRLAASLNCRITVTIMSRWPLYCRGTGARPRAVRRR
jgi:two-component system phosphate regulon sensor histidine kinase PhoR